MIFLFKSKLSVLADQFSCGMNILFNIFEDYANEIGTEKSLEF